MHAVYEILPRLPEPREISNSWEDSGWIFRGPWKIEKIDKRRMYEFVKNLFRPKVPGKR